MSLLEVSRLNVRYGGVPAVDDVSFSVLEGRWLMIVGPNGAGKSTIVKALSRGVPYTGRILLNGREIGGIAPADYAKAVGVLTQTHTVAYGFTVEEVVRMGRYAHRRNAFSCPEGDDEEKIAHAMAMTGLLDLKDKSVLEVSGGELQRVFLAQVLAQDPKLILLDEPVNHLDLVFQKRVLELLDGWMREKGRAIVSVVHDLSLAKAYGTDALLVNEGRAVAFGGIDSVLNEGNLKEVYGMDVSAWNRELLAQWQG
ncbi:MAG: ABC transporter ATP-binding protein [Christensenellales bacterium]|jgi:iron complex transport system ATP-binding protein